MSNENSMNKTWIQILMTAGGMLVLGALAYGQQSERVTGLKSNVDQHVEQECHLKTCEAIARQGEQIEALQRGQEEIKGGLDDIQQMIIERLPRPQ